MKVSPPSRVFSPSAATLLSFQRWPCPFPPNRQPDARPVFTTDTWPTRRAEGPDPGAVGPPSGRRVSGILWREVSSLPLMARGCELPVPRLRSVRCSRGPCFEPGSFESGRHVELHVVLCVFREGSAHILCVCVPLASVQPSHT